MKTAQANSRKSYKYIFIQNYDNEHGVPCSLFRFRSTKTKQVFLIHIEKYPNNFWALKFHLKSDSDSKHKYNKLTDANEPKVILNTCTDLLLELQNKYQNVSFGFVGARTIERNKRLPNGKSRNHTEKSEKMTKRFIFYKRYLLTYFSESEFEHLVIEEKSAYAMFRKTELLKDPELPNKIVDYFTDNYDSF